MTSSVFAEFAEYFWKTTPVNLAEHPLVDCARLVGGLVLGYS